MSQLSQVQANVDIVDSEKFAKLVEWMYEVIDNGTSHYHGMSYEEGMRDMIEVLSGDTDPEELMG